MIENKDTILSLKYELSFFQLILFIFEFDASQNMCFHYNSQFQLIEEEEEELEKVNEILIAWANTLV